MHRIILSPLRLATKEKKFWKFATLKINALSILDVIQEDYFVYAFTSLLAGLTSFGIYIRQMNHLVFHVWLWNLPLLNNSFMSNNEIMKPG